MTERERIFQAWKNLQEEFEAHAGPRYRLEFSFDPYEGISPVGKAFLAGLARGSHYQRTRARNGK